MILAIDDDPGRFDHLRRLLDGRGIGMPLVVASCARCVAHHIPRALAVLLDHDLGPARCPACGVDVPGRENGRKYLPAIRASGLPCIVVSCSSRENVAALCDGLAGHQYTRIAAIETDPELRWLGWLWARGVM